MQEKMSVSSESSFPPGTILNGHHVYISAVSAAMRGVERVVADIAATNIPVLLVGESGTGKEVIAAQLHRLSSRREQPFTKITCASLSPELFAGRPRGGNGHAPAEGLPFWGTVLFDEVAELDLTSQAKFLGALPEGDAPSISAGGPRGARLICTTSRNLDEEMRAGRFREELYYRINGVCLRLPPLRQRREDIPLLADFFLTKYAATFGRPQPQLSPSVMAQLCEHHWPGNVRELENVIKKVVALGDERAALADLRGVLRDPLPMPSNGGSCSLKDAARAASRQAEKELILKVLGRTRWNRKRAAAELQISYKALLYKLKQIGLDDQIAG
jgi:two-component system response regulator AtoC